MIRAIGKSAIYEAVRATWTRQNDDFLTSMMAPEPFQPGCDCGTKPVDAESACCPRASSETEDPRRSFGRLSSNSAYRQIAHKGQRALSTATANRISAQHRLNGNWIDSASSGGVSQTLHAPQYKLEILADRLVRSGLPCDGSAQNPYDHNTEEDAWREWWLECGGVPEGMYGPGAWDCNPAVITLLALGWCCEQAKAASAHPDLVNCNDNFAYYAWVDEDCNVVDAVCGYRSDYGPLGGHLSGPWMLPGDVPPPPDTTTPNPGFTLPAPNSGHSSDFPNSGHSSDFPIFDLSPVIEVYPDGSWLTEDGIQNPPPSFGDEWRDELTDEQWDEYTNLSEDQQAAYDSIYEDLLGPTPATQDQVDDLNSMYCEPGGTMSDSPDANVLCAALDAYTENHLVGGGVGGGGQVLDPMGDADPCGPPFYLLC